MLAKQTHLLANQNDFWLRIVKNGLKANYG